MKRWKTQVAAAHALDIAQSSVWEWQKRGIPFLRQQQIERVTGGELIADIRHAPKREREDYGQTLCRTGKAA